MLKVGGSALSTDTFKRKDGFKWLSLLPVRYKCDKAC